MTETPSVPRRVKTTMIVAIAQASDRHRAAALGWDHHRIKKEFDIEIGEIQAVLVEIREALRFVPRNLHIKLYIRLNWVSSSRRPMLAEA